MRTRDEVGTRPHQVAVCRRYGSSSFAGIWVPDAGLILLGGLILKHYLLLSPIGWGISLSTLTM